MYGYQLHAALRLYAAVVSAEENYSRATDAQTRDRGAKG